MTLPKRHKPGSHWRVLVHGAPGPVLDVGHDAYKQPTEFDEVVVDEWLHLEQLDSRLWSLRLGPLLISIHVGERGQADEVTVDCDEDGWSHDDVGMSDVWKKL